MRQRVVWLRRCGIAVVASSLALAPWLLFHRQLEPSPFLLLLVAVVVAAAFGDASSGLLAAALSLLGILAFYSPTGTVGTGLSEGVQLGVFVASSLFIVRLTQRLHQARTRAEEAQRRTERALEAHDRAQQEKAAILATLAHDLRNPLTGIKGSAYLLRRQCDRDQLDPDTVRDRATHIEETVERAIRLIGELQETFSHLEDSASLSLGPCDLVQMTHAILADHAPNAGAHQLIVDAAVPSLIGRWDAHQVRRVIDNLVSNAVKYSPGGGAVVVSVRREEDESGAWAVLAVRDEGLGIPAADLPRVLEMGGRGSNVGEIPGFGLGLAGVQRIVTEHGGRIEVESVEGVGTTVRVRLPLGARGAAGSPAASADHAGG